MHIGEEARRLLWVSAAFTALTVVMAYPLSVSPGSMVVVDAPDTRLYIWTLAWDAYAFLHQPLRIFDANIYHPYANTLAYSENLIGSAAFAAPVLWLTGNPVLAMNVAALATGVLCGVGGYVLARRWQLSPPAAFLCGLVFAFAPPRFFRTGQLHITAVQWIPFTLAFLHTYFSAGRRRDLLLAIGAFTLQVLSSGHGAAFLVIAIVLLGAWHAGWQRRIAWRQWLRHTGVAGAYLLAPSLWVVLPYRIAQVETGLRREYPEEAMPGLASFLASPSRLHTALQETLFGTTLNDQAIAYLFPGVLVLVLSAAAVAWWRPRTPSEWRLEPVGFYTVLAIVSALMFVRWPVDLWAYVYWWPGFNFIRVPSRFILVIVLCLGVLTAAAFERITRRASGRARIGAAAVVSLLLLAEFSTHPFPSVPFTVDVPPIDRWLNTLPGPITVAELPVPDPRNQGAHERHHTAAMLHATAHWHKTVHGYSGLRRPLHERLYRELATFPHDAGMISLREVGVTHVVVHTDAYPAGEWPKVEARLAATPGLALLHTDGAGRVYAVLDR